MDKYTEKTLSSQQVYHGRIFDVLKDEVMLSDGLKRPRDVIVHPGGVVIAALDGEDILLVRQYRYPVKQAELELPAGRLELGEDPFAAAKRELLEETGYEADEWKSLGFVFTTPGICTEKLYLFRAQKLSFVKQQPDEGEIIDYMKYKISDVIRMIKEGEINDAKTICALMRVLH